MYRGLFDEKHFIIKTSLGDLKNAKRLPTGFYDKHILCAKCDNHVIGQYETYASKVLYGGNNLSKIEAPYFTEAISESGLRSVLVNNISYKKFKLFLLSILWKAHISKQDFFKIVDLDSNAESIRKMILEGNPGEENEFETFMAYIQTKNKLVKSIIDPRPISKNPNQGYIFHINHILYHFNLNVGESLSLFDKGKITKDNKMEFAILEEEFGNKYFNSFLGNKSNSTQ